MNVKGRALSVAVGCTLIMVGGCATAPVSKAPRPGPDFPSSEAFYPYPAKVWAQEGVAEVHFCVDASGRLSADPTLQNGSGDQDLDTAALALSKAGDGHYLPGYQEGKAVAGCADFKVKFILRDDPSFPTLSRRSKQLTNEVRPQWLALKREFQQIQRPAELSNFTPDDQEKLRQLHDFVAVVSPLIKNFDALSVDYVAKMDGIGRADDVSEAERTAFSKHWENPRAYLGQVRETMFDAQAMVQTAQDLIDYVEGAHPPLGSGSEHHEPTEQQRAEISLLIERGLIESREAQARLAKLPDGDTESGRARESSTYAQLPDKQFILLEAVGTAGGLTTSVTNATVPLPTTAVKEIPDCAPPNHIPAFERGTNLLQVRLSDTGTVSSLELERTSGVAELDAQVVKCVSSMRFQPAVQGGKPVPSVIQFPFVWVTDWNTLSKTSCDEFRPKADSHNKKAPSMILCTCWDESGRADGPRILESSGAARLDDGALRLSQASGFSKPRPPGHPGCTAYRTQFDLHD